jgi:transposase-like protein
MTSPTPYQLLPRLTDEEYEALKADIAENGVRVPIDVDENGVILDGHHRAWITADLGIDCPRRTVAGLSEEQKRTHAVAVNVHRRSLSREQRREVVAKLRSEGMAVRTIASTMGVPKSTVARDLVDVSHSGHVQMPETITDSLGREQPASKPRLIAQPEPPSDADLFAGEDWVQEPSPEFEAMVTPPPNPLDDLTDDERTLHKQLTAGETIVVSLRHHQRLIAWADSRGLYERIDRRSPWGNPFELPADGTRDEVIANYEQHYLPYKPSLLDRLHTLKGKALGCWCAPEPCHGDILKNGADEL